MTQKPETNFSAGVNKYLDKRVYFEKTNNPYRGGIPDFYYEGPQGMLWAEYKFASILPPIINLMDIKKKPSLSILQQEWIERTYNNKRPIVVILGWGRGTKKRGVILEDREWEHRLGRTILLPIGFTSQEIAKWITEFLTGSE